MRLQTMSGTMANPCLWAYIEPQMKSANSVVHVVIPIPMQSVEWNTRVLHHLHARPHPKAGNAVQNGAPAEVTNSQMIHATLVFTTGFAELWKTHKRCAFLHVNGQLSNYWFETSGIPKVKCLSSKKDSAGLEKQVDQPYLGNFVEVILETTFRYNTKTWAVIKFLMTFHDTGWFIGILINWLNIIPCKWVGFHPV